MARSSSEPEGAAPHEGLMHPAKADVAKGKSRRRKLRKREDPWPDMLAWKPGAEKRVKARPTHPMVMLEPAGFEREHWTPLHNDERLHDLQLAEAFGTRSYAVMWTFMRQLEALCDEKWWDEDAKQWRIDEPTFNTILALVSSIRPRNEMEAAFAAQMAAVHMLTMRVTARAIKYEWDTKTVAVAGKLARTFAMQMEELRALRGKSRTVRQSIKVRRETHHHQHIHVHRGVGENDAQPHEPNCYRYGNSRAPDERPDLPSPQPSGQVVPLPSRTGKARVQASRR